MKKPKPYTLLSVIVLLILILSFYWFEIRVSKIRQNCVEKITTTDVSGLKAQDYDVALKLCLYKYGIKE
ncbi:hypothetical protein COY07_04265 [Candidatus Peregrinibacteria bacterium CG_4_10_14_0_2_um_filter_43_11]|nr:MAG: hypothetical protein COY07_04265 [Candidatus Peregrinibacteria bacterium CG_4_10_14_0_2_um_filter_43_11]